MSYHLFELFDCNGCVCYDRRLFDRVARKRPLHPAQPYCCTHKCHDDKQLRQCEVNPWSRATITFEKWRALVSSQSVSTR